MCASLIGLALVEELARVDRLARLLEPLGKHPHELFHARIDEARHLRQGCRLTRASARASIGRGSGGLSEGLGRGDEAVERGEVRFQVVWFRSAGQDWRCERVWCRATGTREEGAPCLDETLLSLDEVAVAEEAVDGPDRRLDVYGGGRAESVRDEEGM